MHVLPEQTTHRKATIFKSKTTHLDAPGAMVAWWNSQNHCMEAMHPKTRTFHHSAQNSDPTLSNWGIFVSTNGCTRALLDDDFRSTMCKWLGETAKIIDESGISQNQNVSILHPQLCQKEIAPELGHFLKCCTMRVHVLCELLSGTEPICTVSDCLFTNGLERWKHLCVKHQKFRSSHSKGNLDQHFQRHTQTDEEQAQPSKKDDNQREARRHVALIETASEHSWTMSATHFFETVKIIEWKWRHFLKPGMQWCAGWRLANGFGTAKIGHFHGNCIARSEQLAETFKIIE